MGNDSGSLLSLGDSGNVRIKGFDGEGGHLSKARLDAGDPNTSLQTYGEYGERGLVKSGALAMLDRLEFLCVNPRKMHTDLPYPQRKRKKEKEKNQ